MFDLDNTIIIRGAGDIASGVAYTLHKCGYHIICTDIAQPTTIRRNIAFSEAMYAGTTKVEDVCAKLCNSIQDIKNCFDDDYVAVIVDPDCNILNDFQPICVIDAILAKKNLGTHIDMAPLTIGLGPGFYAGKDVDCAIETMRGHNLGRIIKTGYALANTGIPGLIGGYGKERVIHSPAKGKIKNLSNITDIVKSGDVIAQVYSDDSPTADVQATIDGVLRGLIKENTNVFKGMKIADIDPRINERENCYTISDKARCLGGSCLTALKMFEAHN